MLRAQSGDVPVPLLTATVHLDAATGVLVDAAGAPVRYRLEFEPFGGHLVGAVRQ